jgi:hypothetical protein
MTHIKYKKLKNNKLPFNSSPLASDITSNMKKKKVATLKNFSQGPTFYFSKWVLPVENINDTLRLKSDSIMVNYFKTIKLILGGRLTFKSVQLMLPVIRRMQGILKTQGIKGLCLYLKVCSIYLQQALAGHRIEDSTLLKCKISRTRFGLPRIIPKSHRMILRNWSCGAPLLAKFYLSIFGIYRILNFVGKLSLNSITDPGSNSNFEFIYQWIPLFWTYFTKRDRSDPLQFLKDNCKPFGINKASPNTSSIISSVFEEDVYMNDQKKKELELKEKGKKVKKYKKNPSKWRYIWSTHPDAMFHSSWAVQLSSIKSHYVWFQNLFAQRGSWAKPTSWFNQVRSAVEGSQLMLGSFECRVTAAAPDPHQYIKFYNDSLEPESDAHFIPEFFLNNLSLGALGIKDEPAGKVRVFAMVDNFTQWLLRPLHRFLFNYLKGIPMDGTFDQLRPILRLLKRRDRMTRWPR